MRQLKPPAGAASVDDAYAVSRRYAGFVFAMTFMLMLFDFIDRQIVISMFPHLGAEWGLSDKQLGALVSVVPISVALATVPISLAADRWSRPKSVAAMGAVWSLATIGCGFASSYEQLLAWRLVVGLGEAGYGPVAGAILAGLFPARMRAAVLGGVIAASSLGSVLGVALGGVIAQHWGWRAAFGVVGFPGLVLALMFLFVRNQASAPPRDLRSPGGGVSHARFRTIAAAVLRPRTVVCVCAGSALQLFVLSTLYTWMPSFLHRYYGLASDEAGLKAAIVVLVGAVGTPVWGHLADRAGLAGRPQRKLQVVAAACLFTLAALSLAFGLLQPGPVQFALIVIGGFGLTCTLGTTPAVVMDVVDPGLRATATAMVALIQGLFGLAGGAFVAGALSDAFGLHTALALIPVASLGAAWLFVAAGRSYEADRMLPAALRTPKTLPA